MSRRDLSELAGELFQVGVSTGALDAICRRASRLLAEPAPGRRGRVLAAALRPGRHHTIPLVWWSTTLVRYR